MGWGECFSRVLQTVSSGAMLIRDWVSLGKTLVKGYLKGW